MNLTANYPSGLERRECSLSTRVGTHNMSLALTAVDSRKPQSSVGLASQFISQLRQAGGLRSTLGSLDDAQGRSGGLRDNLRRTVSTPRERTISPMPRTRAYLPGSECYSTSGCLNLGQS